jgi:hypothetical protein
MKTQERPEWTIAGVDYPVGRSRRLDPWKLLGLVLLTASGAVSLMVAVAMAEWLL